MLDDHCSHFRTYIMQFRTNHYKDNVVTSEEMHTLLLIQYSSFALNLSLFRAQFLLVALDRIYF